MFSCLSRKERPPSKMKSSKANEAQKVQKAALNSLENNNISAHLQSQKLSRHVKISPQIKVYKMDDEQKNVEIITKPTKLQSSKIEDMSEDQNKFTSVSGQQNVTVQDQTVNFRTSFLQIKEVFSKEGTPVSQTSFDFGFGFQETQVELKKQITVAVSDLTKMPKQLQSSIQGMKKITQLDDPQDVPQQQQQSSFQQDLNEQFSRLLIGKKFADAEKIYKKMSTVQRNSFDKVGYSPMHLATLLSILYQKQALKTLKVILKDKSVDPTVKNTLGSKPIQQAILFKSISTLTNIFKASYLHKIASIKKSLNQIVRVLETLPDFTIELYAKVGSFVPLVDKLTPDDTIKVSKKGENLRVDYTLVGYSFLKSKRRSMSCVCQKINQDDYTIFIINHDKKCYTDLLDPIEDQQMVLFIQDLLSTQLKRTRADIQKTEIKKELNIFNQNMRELIANRLAVKHELKVIYNSGTQKLQPRSKNPQKDLQFLSNWEQYVKSRSIVPFKSNKKELKLGVWLSEEFPLKLAEVLQVMKFLSFSHEAGSIIYNFLSDDKIRQMISGFPVKLQIPMNFSLFLDIKINFVELKCSQVKFDFTNVYKRQKRCQYQKTLIRKQKRLALLKLYT